MITGLVSFFFVFFFKRDFDESTPNKTEILVGIDAGPPLRVSTGEKPGLFKFLLFVSLLLYNYFGLFSHH